MEPFAIESTPYQVEPLRAVNDLWHMRARAEN
jgi:hypothetical protein